MLVNSHSTSSAAVSHQQHQQKHSKLLLSTNNQVSPNNSNNNVINLHQQHQQHNSTQSTNNKPTCTQPMLINTTTTSYSASYTNLKSSSTPSNSSSSNTNNNNKYISRQSSTLTMNVAATSNNNIHKPLLISSSISSSNTTNFGGNNQQQTEISTTALKTAVNQQLIPNTNFSQNHPKTLNSVDYNTQSTNNSPSLANKAYTSKHSNFHTTTQSLPSSISSNTISNNSTMVATASANNPNSSVQISTINNINRQVRSTSNGNDVLPNTTNLGVNTMRTNSSNHHQYYHHPHHHLRGLASSNSSSSLLTTTTSTSSHKLPPLSLHRLEKSTSDSSLENLHVASGSLEPATPRVVNIDKYFKFAQLIMDEEACEVFLEFLRRKRNEENLEFILQVSALKKIPTLNHGSAIEILQRIRTDFLTNGSMYELNVNKQIKSLSIERIDRCLQQQSMSSSHSSLNFASSPVFSLIQSSSPSTVSTLTYSTTANSVDNSYDSPSLISSSFSSLSLLHSSSPRDHSECSSSSTFTEIPHQPITTGTILKEIELEVRLQLQNESFKEFKASDEFEHFLLTKVIEQSQNNNPVNDQSPQNSPHQSESVSSSKSDKSNSTVGSPQSSGFFSKIFKKKSTTNSPIVQETTRSDESITDDEMSVGSGESDYVYNPQNPNDITFVENLQIRKWNNQQVINFFKFKLDLPEYTDSLKKNDIKGVDLSLLKKEDSPDQAADKIDTSDLQKKIDALYRKIKLVKLGHKKKLQREVNEAIIAYQKKQQKSNKVSSIERPRKVSDSILPRSQISTAMEADLATIIVKLWILPTDQKRVFTVKRCIKLDRLKTIILKEVSDIIEKKYPSENSTLLLNNRVVKTSKGESLTSNEKLYQYLCSESTNSQFVTLKIEI